MGNRVLGYLQGHRHGWLDRTLGRPSNMRLDPYTIPGYASGYGDGHDGLPPLYTLESTETEPDPSAPAIPDLPWWALTYRQTVLASIGTWGLYVILELGRQALYAYLGWRLQ